MKFIISIAIVVVCTQLHAQQTYPRLAKPGAKGIFVMTSDTISDVKGPVTGYRIERKAGNEKDFTLVATLPAVTDAATFKQHAAQSSAWLPYTQDLSVYRWDSIWARGKATGNLKTLRNVGYALPVMAGFNMVWLDEKVTPGKTYQYRISATGTAYTVLSTPVVFGHTVPDTLHYMTALYNQPSHTMELNWLAKGTNKPVVLEAYRMENGGGYTKVPAAVSYLPKKDTFAYAIRDTTALPGKLYRYYVKAFDGYGNAAPLTDTLLLASLDYQQMPLPRQVMAVSDSTLHAIHISWQLPSASLIKSLTLYRSLSSSKGFEQLVSVSPGDSVYVDQQVQPATAYFYYFEAEYKTQDKPKRSTSFAGTFIDHTAPLAPERLQVAGTQQGVELKWQYGGPNVSGFWLYRAERGQPLQLITTMIAAMPGRSDYTYMDTDSLLNGGKFYSYAVKAFSTSHIEGSFSDTVVARPLKNIPVPKPPMRIHLTKEEGLVLVQWEAVSKYDESVAGYRLLRSRQASPGTDRYTTDTIFCTNNLYKDTLVTKGATIRYSVITQSLFGTQSAPASWVSVNKPLPTPATPTSLAAHLVTAGVQLTWEIPDTDSTLSYHVYRYERGQAPVKAGSVNNNGMFKDNALTKGKQYFYFVKSVSTDKMESGKSNEASIRY